MSGKRVFEIFVLSMLAACARAQLSADINLNVRHTVGGVSEFDRSKFITIHASHTDSDWNGGQNGFPNFTNDLLADFILGNDVYFGRDTGYITWQIKNNIDEDPARPGWAKVSGGNYSIATEGAQSRNSYNADTAVHPYENRSQDTVIAAQFRPFWPEGTANCGRTGSKWALSTTDTPAEPFGSATGNYMGNFLNHYYGSATQVGRPLPRWVEVLNEPDWPLFEWAADPAYGTASPAKLWTLHNSVADQIHNLNTNVLVGGYCPAFPDLERDNFAEWKDEWVSFIDTCGTNLDFYTIHLYDIDSSSKYLIRRGSFTEAVFDMIEQYSQLQLGRQLPFVISEYAGKDTALQQQGWSAFYDWKRIKSMSGYLMSFMDRPNLIGKTIPFILVKAEWGRNSTTGIPYGARLMRQADESLNPTNTTGNWVYTEQVKFYQLWSDVKGTRVEVSSSDPDLQVDAYVSSNKAYVILNNMDTLSQAVDLNLYESFGNAVQSVREKNLYWDGLNVVLDDVVHTDAVSHVELGAEGTAILEYTFASDVLIDQQADETKYYATTYFQPISAGQASTFSITNVTGSAYGKAFLRLGMGRTNTLSRHPAVLFNGTPLTVPTDFMGHEGDDRTVFFGTLEIPVPYNLIQSNNTVSVTYPDSGGYISSLALRTYAYSTDISSTAGKMRGDFVGPDLILSFSNAPIGRYYSLLSKSNMLDAAWATEQADLRFDNTGFGSVTSPVILPQQFFTVKLESPPAVPVPGGIEFTAPDYFNGALNGQQNWNAESGWVVADAAGAGYAATPDNSSAAVLNQPVQLAAGQTFSLRINFQFGGTYATPTGYVYAFLAGLKDTALGASVSTSSTAADANIQIFKNADTYRLLNNWSTISGCSNITGSQLNAGDILQFDYTLTLGADAASTSYTVRLQNLTDGTDTGWGTVTGVDASIYTALTGSGAYPFFQSITPGANGSGLSGVQVNSVTITVP